MDEHFGSTTSLNIDTLSVGTADAQPIVVHHASIVHNAPSSTATPYDEMDQHILPSPNFSRLSPLRPVSRRAENAKARPISASTMDDLRKPQSKRRSIIDPATVRVSFTGNITDISSPLTLPIEEGLQKLYKLYNECANPTIPLPHTLSITEVPLSTIADALSSHIKAQSKALLDCAQNLHAMTNLQEQMRKDLITLEQHYSLAVEKGNIAAMSTEDVRRRLGWQIEEIIRINMEKETAIIEAAHQKNETQRLSTELEEMAEILKENERMKETEETKDQEIERLKFELEETEKELAEIRKELQTVPEPIKKLYVRLSDGSGRQRKKLQSKNGKVRELRTGLLIPASPKYSDTFSQQ